MRQTFEVPEQEEIVGQVLGGVGDKWAEGHLIRATYSL